MSGRKIAIICCLLIFAIFFSSGSESPQCGCGPFLCPFLRVPKPTQGAAEPKILYFTANKYDIKPGDPVALQWSTANADHAYIEAPGMGTTVLDMELGEMGVNPTVTTTYTLFAKSYESGVRNPVVSKSLTIRVVQPQIKIPPVQGPVPPTGTPASGGGTNCP